MHWHGSAIAFQMHHKNSVISTQFFMGFFFCVEGVLFYVRLFIDLHALARPLEILLEFDW